MCQEYTYPVKSWNRKSILFENIFQCRKHYLEIYTDEYLKLIFETDSFYLSFRYYFFCTISWIYAFLIMVNYMILVGGTISVIYRLVRYIYKKYYVWKRKRSIV